MKIDYSNILKLGQARSFIL